MPEQVKVTATLCKFNSDERSASNSGIDACCSEYGLPDRVLPDCDSICIPCDTCIWYTINPIVLRKAKTVYSFGLSECKRVKEPCWFSRSAWPRG